MKNAPDLRCGQGMPKADVLGVTCVIGRRVWLMAGVVALLCGGSAWAQLFDALDAHPPRWNLGESDCGARVVSHGHLPSGGLGGRPCESLVFLAGHGTRALLVYPIEPTLPLDQVHALVGIKSARGGARVGLRVRYPFITNAETRRPESVVIYGATYESPGEFARLGVGGIETQLKVKTIAIRNRYGRDADPSSPYIDAVVVDAYSGPGTTSICLDDLSVDGMVSVGAISRSPGDGFGDGDGDNARSSVSAGNPLRSELGLRVAGRVEDGSPPPAFPPGRVTRILQHNGEPLAFVRSLGFDAVLLSRPPTAEILREAIRARLRLYAPPPSAPVPELESILEPIAGWYLGTDVALDGRRVDQTRLTSERLRRWPRRWRRPLVAAPVEAFDRYAPLVDAVICDQSMPTRGIDAFDAIEMLGRARQEVGDQTAYAVGVATMPPEPLLRQTQAIADSIGAPGPTSIRWHALWAQTFQAFQRVPQAILFRSTRSLASGAAIDGNRSTSLGFINRCIAVVEPWLSVGRPSYTMDAQGANYHVGRVQANRSSLILATSMDSRRGETLAGDGQTLDIVLSPEESAHMYWRLTHFSAERLMPKLTPRGATLQVVSPDVVEVILTSRTPSIGAQAGSLAARHAKQAAADRWQLAAQRVEEVDQAWKTAISMRTSPRARPSDLVAPARESARQSESLFRSGQIEASLRMARRADAWALRAEWQLGDDLMQRWPAITSAPPLESGSILTQIVWTPLTEEDDWGHNRLSTGTLNSADLLTAGRWTFGRRLSESAKTEVAHTTRDAFAGSGALFARSTPLVSSGPESRLPGGYAGTAIQITSPSVHLPAGTTYRIDAMVKTLGFGDPHQGLLIYESTGGPEMGILVRGKPRWTPIRIYRRTIDDEKVSVLFELLGGGEVTIDEISLRVWEPDSPASYQVRPIRGAIKLAPISGDRESPAQVPRTTR